MRYRFLLLAPLAACASTPTEAPDAGPAEPTFAIQLHRPSQIGDVRKHSTTMTSIESLVATAEDAVLQQRHDEVRVIFVATEKVLDINDRGSVTRSEYVIEEAFAESQTGRKELLVPGAVLVVSRGVEPPFALEKGRIPPDVEKILTKLFTTSQPTRTDDDIFGTDSVQPVGGRWPIHADLAARDLTEAGLAVETVALTGETELTAVETLGTVECLQISTRLAADNVTPLGVPSGATLESTRLTASFAGMFPTDRSKQRLSDSSEMSAEFTLSRTVDGRPVRMMTMMKQSRQSTYSDVTPGT